MEANRKDLYLDTSKIFQQLSSDVYVQSRNWEVFVKDEENRREIYQCKEVSCKETCKGLVVQLFKEQVCTCSTVFDTKLMATTKGSKIAKWAPGIDTKKPMIRGPFWLKSGKVELKEGRMLVLPLVDPPGTGTADKPAQQPKVIFRPLKWNKEDKFPIEWQACSPLLIPENAELVLEKGDIKFVIVQVVMGPETSGRSQVVGDGE